jgi:hypothetical protein
MRFKSINGIKMYHHFEENKSIDMELMVCSTITLHSFFLQYENTAPWLFITLIKVRDEIERDINFKRK